MRTVVALSVITFVLSFAAAANAQDDKVEVFGGYSYAQVPVTVVTQIVEPTPLFCRAPGPCPSEPSVITTTSTANTNVNGWEAAGIFKAKRWLGLAADFSGDYGSTNGASVHLQTYLFGPQFSLPAKISPFAHVLLGGAHESLGNNPNVSGPASANGFALTSGGGVDLRATHFLSVRVIQVDDLETHFSGGSENRPRISAGLVFRF